MTFNKPRCSFEREILLLKMNSTKESEACVENDNTEYAGFLVFKTYWEYIARFWKMSPC